MIDQSANRYDYMAEAYEWTRNTWTLEQVRDELEGGFGIPLARNSLRNLLVDIGIGPIAKLGSGDAMKGPGRVGYYDPLVCWVVYVAHRCQVATRSTLGARIDDYRDVARKEVWGRLANTPKKRDRYDDAAWDWRVESTAYHLFISDVEFGPEPRALHDLLAPNPHLLYHTLDSNMCLESVLRVYVANYVSRSIGIETDPNQVNLLSGARPPLFNRTIVGTDTLAVLEQFKVLRHGGSRMSEPDHLYFDYPDIHDPEYMEAHSDKE